MVLLPFPFDLHVLGPPLAFILSQDQTLHCKSLLHPSCLHTQSMTGGLFSYSLNELLGFSPKVIPLKAGYKTNTL